MARWSVPDMLAELSYDWTPYRYGFNNPILYTDPFGLWEKTAGGYKTDDAKDIDRFFNMIGAEQGLQKQGANFAQMSNFISGEMSGGLGKLSDGSRLAEGFSMTAYRQVGGGLKGYADKKSFSNFWHGIQKDLNPDVLDTRTLNRNYVGSYPGPNNPQTYNKKPDYTYMPSNPVEYPAIRHDLAYDRLNIKGASGLFKEPRAIGADWRFVREQIAIGTYPRIFKQNFKLLG